MSPTLNAVLEIRVGIHTGECESVNGDLFGLAVNIGARVASLAERHALSDDELADERHP